MDGFVPRLSLGLVGFEGMSGLAARMAWARQMGYSAVQLNAAEAGVRPRELGRSARRDIAATGRRAGVEISGVDLWIPPEHFVDAAHSDRAMDAVREALAFASEVVPLSRGVEGGAGEGRGRGVVSLTLPASDEHNQEAVKSVARAMGDHAQRVGAVIADFQWPADPRSTGDPIGVGIDPAAVIAEGVTSAGKAASRMGARLAGARLTDLSSAGLRVEPGGGGWSGGGRLDVMSYLVALATAGYAGAVVVDLRGVADARNAAGRCATLGAIGGLGGGV